MASYRNLQMSFWTDSKILENFSAQEKYIYLYLLTNPHTSLCGCYEISFSTMAFETALKKEEVEQLVQNLVQKGVISYSNETNEVLIVNWHRYNWTSSDKVRKALEKIINHVKCLEFQQFLTDTLNGNDTVSIPYLKGSDTSVSVSVSDIDINKSNKRNSISNKQLKSEFENLWKLYPKKQGKDKAYGYYERARKSGTTYEEVEQGINAYVRHIEVTNTEMRYVKMGSTFFSQKSWLDEYQDQPASSGNPFLDMLMKGDY